MLNLRSRSIKSIFVIIVFTAYSLSANAFAFDASMSITSKLITFSSNDSAVKSISVSVLSPSGDSVFSETVNGNIVSWALSEDSADGNYKYEVIMSSIASASRTRGTDFAVTPEVSKKSGTVWVKTGVFVVPVESEEGSATDEVGMSIVLEGFNQLATLVLDVLVPAAHADIVQADDVIVQGSSCVGNDCNNGESFGFDTFRLKENNLRLHFQDTSSSSSFPSNDWRILINDTTNGGGNFFSIEDSDTGQRVFTLDGGAPANSLYVDQSGRVGFGTSNPGTALEAKTGNTPALRLNQDGSFGFPAQAWDLGSNETGVFFRDVTNGSLLPFRVNTGAPTDSFVVGNNGNIGVGIANPTAKMHVMGNAIISGNLELGSSRYIKNQIKDLGLEQALAAFKALEPVMFKYNHSPNEQSIGFIAEDVPDLVASQSRKSLKPMDIVAVLTKVVQEQQKTIDELSGKIDILLNAE